VTTLVLAPHPDDEVIGCGGTLALLGEEHERVVVAFLTSGELGLPQLDADQARSRREAEAEQASPLLQLDRLLFLRQPDWGLTDVVEPTVHLLRGQLTGEDISRVYLPHAGDGHPDHAAAAQIGRRWAASLPTRVELRAYEVWSPLPTWDLVHDITSVMDRKLAAVAAYASQDFYNYGQAVTGLARYRGALAARTAYAEVFAQVTVEEQS